MYSIFHKNTNGIYSLNRSTDCSHAYEIGNATQIARPLAQPTPPPAPPLTYLIYKLYFTKNW